MSEKNKNIVKEINEAFARGDSDTFLTHCKENVTWEIVGEKKTRGKAAVREWMSSMEDLGPPTFTVDKVVADENSVVCFGEMRMKNKEGALEPYAFVDFYEFDGEQISDLRSFLVKHKHEGAKEKAA